MDINFALAEKGVLLCQNVNSAVQVLTDAVPTVLLVHTNMTPITNIASSAVQVLTDAVPIALLVSMNMVVVRSVGTAVQVLMDTVPTALLVLMNTNTLT